MNLSKYIQRQEIWSKETFGPGIRDAGIVDHIKKELIEIEDSPGDLDEWIDVIILALDGAWRNGHSPKKICVALIEKQIKNEKRKWPDWKTAEPGKAIEHVKYRCEQCKDTGVLGSITNQNYSKCHCLDRQD